MCVCVRTCEVPAFCAEFSLEKGEDIQFVGTRGEFMHSTCTLMKYFPRDILGSGGNQYCAHGSSRSLVIKKELRCVFILYSG